MLPIDSNFNPAVSAATLSASGKDSLIKDNFLDQNSLNAVKAMGRKNDPQALKEIAKKFEAMFVQQMMKSMRDASEVFADGDMFSSSEVKFHQDMLDQQMVLNLTSGKGIGLATSMYQQMQAMYNKNSSATIDAQSTFAPVIKPLANNIIPNVEVNAPPVLISRASIVISKNSVAQTQEEFVAALMPFAKQAAAELNIKTDVLLAQAALETGWGKHVIHDTQGNNSFNIFNIKKSNSWEGKSVHVKTLEYQKGIAQQEHAEFRQYNDYRHSFLDYVNVMKTNPRYQHALGAGATSAGYADALQAAGYATDPDYAEKIKQLLMNDAIRSATVTDAKAAIKLSAVDISTSNFHSG
jgi:peptidoglycan hydrolase FlgJ